MISNAQHLPFSARCAQQNPKEHIVVWLTNQKKGVAMEAKFVEVNRDVNISLKESEANRIVMCLDKIDYQDHVLKGLKIALKELLNHSTKEG